MTCYRLHTQSSMRDKPEVIRACRAIADARSGTLE